jgi:hypothetical protein
VWGCVCVCVGGCGGGGVWGGWGCVCVTPFLCKGIVPFRGGGAALPHGSALHSPACTPSDERVAFMPWRAAACCNWDSGRCCLLCLGLALLRILDRRRTSELLSMSLFFFFFSGGLSLSARQRSAPPPQNADPALAGSARTRCPHTHSWCSRHTPQRPSRRRTGRRDGRDPRRRRTRHPSCMRRSLEH